MFLRKEKIPINSLFLDLENPRFEPVRDEAAAIAHLAIDEKVSALAEDIIQQKGLNPLEIVGVMLASKKGQKARYTVLEGNRRICALKLLGDPDLAPPTLRSRFEKLAARWHEVKSIDVIVFTSRDEAKPWLERLHEGEKEGVGRKSWDPRQTQRFTGSGKNAQAMKLLEIAENEGWVAKGETDKILTTVQRFLNNPVVRNQLGIEGKDREVLRISRPQDEFKKLAERFIKDAVESRASPMNKRLVHSRANGQDMVSYANNLSQRVQISQDRIDPEIISIGSDNQKTKQTRKTKPRAPAVPSTLHYDREAYSDLKKIGNQKLTNVYYSLCSLELAEHAVLISVGIWSFFECLTSAAGRTETTPLLGFLSRDFLQNQCGIAKDDSKAVIVALDSIYRRGNDSKHHAYAGSYDPKEINNNWVVTAGLVMALIKKIVLKK